MLRINDRMPLTLSRGPATSPRPRTILPRRLALKRVALLIETSGSYGRGLLRGIARYNREHGNWSTCFRPHALGDPPPAWLRNFKGDGLLVRINSPELADTVRKLAIPAVNLKAGVECAFPQVRVDNALVAQLAAQHLVERGIEHFAFCGRPQGVNPTLDERAECFRDAIERLGVACHVYRALNSEARTGWEHEQERLADWIWSLPRPLGIMAANDERGLQVLDACRRCGLRVPDEVAVIGVDNDESLCDLAIPPLTSIDANSEGVGYEAASLLDRMMNGQRPAEALLKLPPRGVITRASTDTVATDDEEVSRAVRFIREQACAGLQVVDVLAHVGMSRASLQQRMKQVLGRTIHQEIQRVRLARVKDLLSGSQLTIKQVARQSGFASVQYLTRVFRAATGETPARYRRRRTR